MEITTAEILLLNKYELQKQERSTYSKAEFVKGFRDIMTITYRHLP